MIFVLEKFDCFEFMGYLVDDVSVVFYINDLMKKEGLKFLFYMYLLIVDCIECLCYM